MDNVVCLSIHTCAVPDEACLHIGAQVSRDVIRDTFTLNHFYVSSLSFSSAHTSAYDETKEI